MKDELRTRPEDQDANTRSALDASEDSTGFTAPNPASPEGASGAFEISDEELGILARYYIDLYYEMRYFLFETGCAGGSEHRRMHSANYRAREIMRILGKQKFDWAVNEIDAWWEEAFSELLSRECFLEGGGMACDGLGMCPKCEPRIKKSREEYERQSKCKQCRHYKQVLWGPHEPLPSAEHNGHDGTF